MGQKATFEQGVNQYRGNAREQYCDATGLSRAFVEKTKKPVFLAGGLTPENVGEAIARVKPFGVDVCSGVRTNGHLDPKKLEAFMGAIRTADRHR